MPRSFALARSVHTFFRWWESELASFLLPPDDDGRQRGKWLVVSLEGDRIRAFEEHGSKRRELGQRATGYALENNLALEDFISVVATSATKRRLPVAIRVAAENCLERNLTLPAAALRDLPRILALDLERSTPFQADQVLTCYATKAGARNPATIDVRQFVLKRDRLGRIPSMLDKAGVTVTRIDCWETDGQTGVPVNFLSVPVFGVAAQRRNVRLAQFTVAASLLFLFAAALVNISRLESHIAEVALQTEEARSAVAEIRKVEAMEAAAARNQQVLASMMSGQVSRAFLLDSLTRLVPDSDHLVELRIEGDQVSFSGFSVSTAALVPTIERSPMFAGVTLTAPVTRDRHTDSDRFSLTVQTTGHLKAISAGSAGTGINAPDPAKGREEG
ncbi:MAG: PilN domain-containing protein [Alphaproteobacteria bacterium]|nr:PilN domain-containing protein [Alphaproteobacteria bacterium]